MLRVWQLVPKYPVGQVHVYVEPVPVVVQVAPFKHGVVKQILVSNKV